ncbi:MAG: CBS domain-containing protein [Candidatus Brocadiia bacterium]
MTIRKVMRAEPLAVAPDEPLINAVEATASARIRHLPVVKDDDTLVGMLTENDIKHATPSPLIEGNEAEYRRILHETPCGRVMRRDPVTASPNQKLSDVVRLLVEHKIGAVPIVEGKKLVGIVSEVDILQTFLQILEVIE